MSDDEDKTMLGSPASNGCEEEEEEEEDQENLRKRAAPGLTVDWPDCHI
jgi:hypothetical protein